jgi:hypothetical protein
VVDLRLEWIGGQVPAHAREIDPLPARLHYYSGAGALGQSGSPLFQSIAFSGIYPGIELSYSIAEDALEYTFQIQPGADARAIHMRPSTGWRVSLSSSGDLQLTRAGLRLRHRKPKAFQLIAGHHSPVDIAFDLCGTSVGFRVGPYDASLPLIIDPVVEFASQLGGSDWDAAYAVASDTTGAVYLTGETTSAAFPGAATIPRSGRDVFVTKIKDGAIVFTTILASSGNDVGNAITVDDAGNIYIAGMAGATNFPITAGALQSAGGGGDVFIARLDSAGRLAYATYLGGSGFDAATGIAVDSSRNIYVAGYTASANFPTLAGAPQQAYRGGNHDAFVIKLNPGGNQLLYATLLGGQANDAALAIAVDSNGSATVAGYTDSSSFPVTSGAAQAQYGGNGDAFVASLNSFGTQWKYVTYLGGSGPDQATAIALDRDGNAYVTGNAAGNNFPVSASAWQTVVRGAYDAFATKLSPAGSFLSGTLLGGSDTDSANAISIDASGNVWLAGYTLSFDFPTRAPLQGSNRGSFEGFVAQLSSDAAGLLFSTYWGGSRDDRIWGLAIGADGDLVVAGYSSSSDFPASAGTPAGGYNAFYTQMVVAPVLATIAAPTPGGVLPASGAVFSWNAVTGADQYWLDIGSALGIGDYFSRAIAGNNATVNALPCDGRTVYVQLWTHRKAAWQPPQRYTYVAASGCGGVSSPANNTTLPATTVAFSWSAVTGADQYWLDVGSAADIGNYFGRSVTGTTVTVSTLPCDGRPVYVQLWVHRGGVWQTPQPTTYTAASGCAALTSPVDNMGFASTDMTFAWNAAAGADQYWLDVGSAIGIGDLFGGATAASSLTVRGLSCDGRPIYVQLWTHTAAGWKNPGRYTFAAWSACAKLAGPSPAGVLSSGAAQFTWSAGSGATAYWLDVGTAPGQGNLFARNLGSALSQNVAIPATPGPIYVQLWSQIAGIWRPNRYTFLH